MVIVFNESHCGLGWVIGKLLHQGVLGGMLLPLYINIYLHIINTVHTYKYSIYIYIYIYIYFGVCVCV